MSKLNTPVLRALQARPVDYHFDYEVLIAVYHNLFLSTNYPLFFLTEKTA